MVESQHSVRDSRSSQQASDTSVSGEKLALLPLKNVVILPKSIIPIIVGRPGSIKAVEYALKHDRSIFITSQKDPKTETPTPTDVFWYGTKSTILQVMRMPNGALKILAEGIQRAKIIKIETTEDFIGVHCETLPTGDAKNKLEIEAIWRQLRTLYNTYAKLNEKAPLDLATTAKTVKDIDHITDTIAVHVNLSFDERQEILETVQLSERMLKICKYLKREIEILQTEQKIRGRIQTQVEKNQREYYLSEQMKAIQKELGREDHASELDLIRKKIKTLGLSQEAATKAEKELKRLEQMPPLSAEAVVSRHYVDWLTSIPWNKTSKDRISLIQAEKILNKHHFGLKKAKERIIEFVAAKKYSKTMERSPIICLVGPPGVGKTSLAQSIAKSMGREFVRISLGGVKDEAEIRGHRRTYIGALPGKIVQSMKKAKVKNPVILLDEIDKISQDIHGDPASALLEVLDPEQNNKFADHFLDVEYDLSKVMFIATANIMEGIPYPLFDRMEIVFLDGYTSDEKIEIARKFLIPKNLREYNLTTKQFKISRDQIRALVDDYTRESGVRQLERVITKLMRKTIQKLLKNPELKNVSITDKQIKEWLGNPTFKKTSLNKEEGKIGISTGLAWTEVGGDVLEIETATLPGKGGLTLTGQLGDVMQESAQAALSYIRSRVVQLGLKNSFYTTKDLHIHMPEGATPKDGPSAGITIATAIASAFTNKPVKKDLAMTGEITLRGKVLPVGGIKEKVLAAKRAGIHTIVLPKRNDKDLVEVPDHVKVNIDFHFIDKLDDALPVVFDTAAQGRREEKVEERLEKTV